MKKMASLLLAVLLLFVSVPGVSAEAASLMYSDWPLSDWSFLTDWGVLTEEEAAMLAADRTAAESGRELVRTTTATVSQTTDETAGVDAELAERLSRTAFITRFCRNEANLSVLQDGAEALSLGLGEKDGLLVLDSSLLPGPVSLSAEDLESLPARLATALQTNGVIDRQEAMRFGMMLASFRQPAWLSLLTSFDPAAYEGVDLTAWNDAMAALSARRAFADAAEQPADCDEAARVWTLTVTPEDVRVIFRAALETLRDNAALLGEPQPSLDLIILQLDSEEFPLQLQLTAHEDAAGELVRLQIDVFGKNDQAAEYQQELQLVYNRRTTAKDTTHELIMGDEAPEAYGAYVITAPHDMYVQSHLLTLGSIGGDGTRTIETAAAFSCVVNDTIPGLKMVQMTARLSWPYYTYRNSESKYAEISSEVVASISHGGVTEHFPQDGVQIIATTTRRVGDEVEAEVRASADYTLDGVDVTGSESFRVSQEGVTVLDCSTELYTQTPSGSLYDAAATRLNALTDGELAAWAAQVQGLVEAWLDAYDVQALLESAEGE